MCALVASVAVNGYELIPQEGQAPLGYVQIYGVSTEGFDEAAWKEGDLNLVPDYRHPFIEPRFDGPWRNIYAPSVVFTWSGWHIFYGAWDGAHSGNDRIYLRTATTFNHLHDPRTVIEHGPFTHVCNVNALQMDDHRFELACTVYPDTKGLNKPAYFIVDNMDTPITASHDHIIHVEGYPNWEDADVNGMNVLYRDDDNLYLYFCDFKNFGTVFRAKQREGTIFDFEGEVFEGGYMVNDVKRFGDSYLMGLHRNRDGIWYSISNEADTFPEEQLLLRPLGELDRYIVAMGWVQAHGKLLGVLYGAGPVKELNRNQIFARWLQKRITFETEDGTVYKVEKSLGSDTALLPLPEGPHVGTLRAWESDGETLLDVLENVKLVSGRNYFFAKNGVLP